MDAFVVKDWHDSPATDTPLSAAALEDAEQRLSDYSKQLFNSAGTQASFGAVSTTTDAVTSRLLIKPVAGDDENGITIKRPSSTWGNSGNYGLGQFIECLKDSVSASDKGYTGVTPDDFVIFRVQRDGSVGIGGNLHLATGLRQPSLYASSYAMFIQPQIDTKLIQFQTIAGATQPFLVGYDSSSNEKWKVASTGNATFGEYAPTGKGLFVGDIGFGSSGYFGISHSDQASTTGYALVQNAAGQTWVNAASGQFVNLAIAGASRFQVNNTQTVIGTELYHTGSKAGFYNTTPISKPTVTGSRGGNAAVASLLTGLAALGLVTDSSSA
jgi:hypothetical protein